MLIEVDGKAHFSGSQKTSHTIYRDKLNSKIAKEAGAEYIVIDIRSKHSIERGLVDFEEISKRFQRKTSPNPAAPKPRKSIFSLAKRKAEYPVKDFEFAGIIVPKDAPEPDLSRIITDQPTSGAVDKRASKKAMPNPSGVLERADIASSALFERH